MLVWLGESENIEHFQTVDGDGRMRKDHALSGLAIIKHMAMKLPTQAKDGGSIRVMRKKAGWNDGPLLRDPWA